MRPKVLSRAPPSKRPSGDQEAAVAFILKQCIDGYLWWRMSVQVATPDGPRRVYMSAAQGNGGQKIYLVPELDLIAVFTGSRYNTGDAPPNKIMAGVVLPALMTPRGVKGNVGAPTP